VLKIVHWLAGHADTDLPDPLERAQDVVTRLSRQRRYEEAQKVREACEHLSSIRRSYESLAEACSLRFALLWAQTENGDGPCVRLNLICDGRLLEPASLYPGRTEEVIGAALETIRVADRSRRSDDGESLVVVPQRELDSLLAVRRWFYETEGLPKVPLPGPGAQALDWETTRARLVDEADALLMKGSLAGEG